MKPVNELVLQQLAMQCDNDKSFTIKNEIDYIKNFAGKIVSNTQVVTCIDTLIRAEIKQTDSRQITLCLRFPIDYPNQHILVELKSRSLSGKLLDGITTLAEQRAKDFTGKPQALEVMKFIVTYIQQNPLCVIYDEIAGVKALLNQFADTVNGELKCRQKSSSVVLTVFGGKYFFKTKIIIPDEYPNKCIFWNGYESNLSLTLLRFLNGQAKEIARQCVEPPLRQNIKDKPFEVKPSFSRTITFLIEATRDFHIEICPICKDKCLPNDPSDIEINDMADNYVERVYCGHLYHQKCLKKYMREPPFPVGGKLCPAQRKHPRSDLVNKNKKRSSTKDDDQCGAINNDCSVRLSHDRWGLNVKLAEARWAQQQARERELEEVVDFLK